MYCIYRQLLLTPRHLLSRGNLNNTCIFARTYSFQTVINTGVDKHIGRRFLTKECESLRRYVSTSLRYQLQNFIVSGLTGFLRFGLHVVYTFILL